MPLGVKLSCRGGVDCTLSESELGDQAYGKWKVRALVAASLVDISLICMASQPPAATQMTNLS